MYSWRFLDFFSWPQGPQKRENSQKFPIFDVLMQFVNFSMDLVDKMLKTFNKSQIRCPIGFYEEIIADNWIKNVSN